MIVGWMQELYDTYEKSSHLVGIEDDAGRILLPIAHSTQNAQIEVAVNLDGEFKGAKRVEKLQAVTIIPVTEDSGSRSSGIAPHPLCDKLCYVAGDYKKYVAKKKEEEYFAAYLSGLRKWHEAGCHEYVEAIYQYLSKENLIRDLVEAGVLVLDENGRLSEKEKIEGIAQTDAFVRFYIQDERICGLGQVWREREVYDDYIKYYLELQEEIDLDYITGERVPCSEKQPSKIRNSADKAKLISANDSSGFTYRGRFTSRKEAVSVGYASSQEAHNALKWLIERQGYRRFGLCIVVWDPADRTIPDWNRDTVDLLYENEAQWLPIADTAKDYAERVNTAIAGKFADLTTENTDIVILSLDAATPGRLAVTYYQEILSSDFLKRLTYWHSSCAWRMSYKKGKGMILMAPSPEDIVYAAYGNERNGRLEVDDKLMKETLERLMLCVFQRKHIPLDIVQKAVGNASRPQAFSAYNYRKILEITCALIHKKYKDKGKEEWDTMSLNRSRPNRDYLYGRLLAVAHKVEYDTFSEGERGKRETNVTRYMSKMVKLPTKTWPMIDLKLKPYWSKLHPGMRIKYEKEMQEIYDLFEPDDFAEPRRLGEEYLLGYSCELTYLWKNFKDDNNGNDEGGNDNE